MKGMGWIDLARYRDRRGYLINVVMNLCAPWNAGVFFTCWGPVSF